jgi:hypothetical protein
MPILHLPDVPLEVYQQLQRLANVHQRTPELEALALLQEQLGTAAHAVSQAEILEDLKRRSFVPPPGSPDSVDWLREDRER